MTKFTEKDLLNRGIVEIIEESNFKKRLKSGKKLRVKFGIDPTGPNIHLGHTVPLWKLRQFQDLGHKVVLIIGDFTATIGDPSGQREERKIITDKEVGKNMENYIEQVGKILDIKKVEIRYNSEWHKKEGLDAMLYLARTASLQQLIKRADFKERIKSGNDVTFIELFYPLLQAYDSVKIKADVEIGGTDQKFNLLMGRQVQRKFGQQEQDVIMLPILTGTDGVKKMSKSFDNYIALLDNAQDMFGKIMSISDDKIIEYFELTTSLPFDELEKLKKEELSGTNARDKKLELAELITSIYWSKKEARDSREDFIARFRKQEVPGELKEFEINKKSTLVDLLVKIGFASSKTDAKRLILQGGVYVDDKKVDGLDIVPQASFVLRVGRRKIAKILLK